MRDKLYRCLALGMALFFAFQAMPLNALAESNNTEVVSSEERVEEVKPLLADSGTEAGVNSGDAETLAPDRAITAVAPEEAPTVGNAEKAGEKVETVSDDQTVQQASYSVTLDLDGGQVNGMIGAGWTQSSYQTYQWTRVLTETEAGQGITIQLDNTLGGVIPEQPYRVGYNFDGWKIGEVSYGLDEGHSVTITANTTIVACWQTALYKVSFQGNDGELWTVEVPYGATLWTDPNTPWTGTDVTWSNEQTATVDVTVGGINHTGVEVTRHGSDDTSYYYTFVVDGIPYFTYGGPTPEKEGQTFASWKLMSGGKGFVVTENAVFAAQFQAEKSYVLNVYYYYENGTRAEETFAAIAGESEIKDGKLTFSGVEIPDITHYTAKWNTLPEGVTWDADAQTVTIETEKVFGADNTSATNFLALTVIYEPSELTCTVQYWQQNKNTEDDYLKVGEINIPDVKYGSKVSITERPELSPEISFEGFQVRADSLSAVNDGVILQEGDARVTFDEQGNATVNVYYDRASYFIYFQTGTTEAQMDPVKVRYGATIPEVEELLKNLNREGYTRDTIKWYSMGTNGTMEEETVTAGITPMPAHDLYAVVEWKPASTSIRLVYWIENRNDASFQNAYTATVEGVTTESELEVAVDGATVTIEGLPSGTDGNTIVAEEFDNLMTSRYGTEAYKTFFSYNAESTKANPANVANAQATNSGNVQDGAIQGSSYKVKVNGDGTTSINIYYTRNLYTLEFVLAREKDGVLEVSTDGKWAVAPSSATSLIFKEFGSTVTATPAAEGETYGQVNVQTTYRLTEAMGRDTRSVVGRYGTRTEGDYNYYVYTLTARFEADISALWPTVSNVATETESGTAFTYKYISMGPDGNSYYRNVVAAAGQKNILNVYSTMDRDVVAMGMVKDQWSATADPGDGTVSHKMVAYWAENPTPYHYYFLYEVLDTTVTKDSDNVKAFDPATADKGEYHTGDYVSWNESVYVYSEASDLQYSTNTPNGQNQPSRQGFEKKGKNFTGKGSERSERNIYFFYDRETYNLDVQNVNVRYSIPASLLTTEFDGLSSYGEGIKTFQQLGWESVNADGTVAIRYGGVLAPMGNEDVVNWLTSANGGNLNYPIQSAGENQYYFWRWYNNATLEVPVDWDNDNEMRIVTSDKTLYAGWFSPRYTTTYVLNGGTWTGEIDYALSTATTQDNHTVYIYYPHQAQNETDPLYWYIQTKDEDRLFVNTLYVCEVGKVAHKDESGAYWELNDGLTVDKMLELSQEDTHGTRLVGHNYCYAGEGGAYNHEKYVNINSAVNSVLAEPSQPVRVGYSFSGWYYFDNVPAQGTKTYLKDVLTGSQSLASYGEEYVYINHVGDAFLLHKDDNGELFYYPEQTGYRFSYSNNASVVVQDRKVYAAWTPNGDTSAVVYHLVEKTEVDNQGWQGMITFTTKDGAKVSVEQDKTITIGNVEYYILQENQLSNLHTGGTFPQSSWEYCADSNSKKWLPAQATIDLYADERTQTVEKDGLQAVTGNTYRIEDENGKYVYYAFFVYHPTENIVYNVYAIDLSVAVAEGALDSYQDTFPRSFQVEDTASYLLSKTEKTFPLEDHESTLVVENAPAVSGYVVYQDWSQELQLQSQSGTNNIFFYYIQGGVPQITYSITYYLMENGGYQPENAVTISNIPAVAGEIIPLTDMVSSYKRLIGMAQTYSTYSGSTNEAKQAIYDRYKNMTVTLTKGEDVKSFTVDTGIEDTLDLAAIIDLPEDYYLDTWSPSGNKLVLSDQTKVEVYLAKARLTVQKEDHNQTPLAGAEFKLERLLEDPTGDISYNGKAYVLDPTFNAVTTTSGVDGKAIFNDLSARIGENGAGYLYRLTEVRAPKGYNCLVTPMYVTAPCMVGGEICYDATYTVVNSGISYLPDSGFFGGVYPVMFLGIGLMAVAVGLAVVFYRRKRFDLYFTMHRDNSSHGTK